MSDEVKRYTVTASREWIDEDSVGEFVSASDYDTLRAERDAALAELSLIQQLARCFRLEDVLDNPSETSETVRLLTAFEVAATLRRQLVKAEAERDTLQARVRALVEKWRGEAAVARAAAREHCEEGHDVWSEREHSKAETLRTNADALTAALGLKEA